MAAWRTRGRGSGGYLAKLCGSTAWPSGPSTCDSTLVGQKRPTNQPIANRKCSKDRNRWEQIAIFESRRAAVPVAYSAGARAQSDLDPISRRVQTSPSGLARSLRDPIAPTRAPCIGQPTFGNSYLFLICSYFFGKWGITRQHTHWHTTTLQTQHTMRRGVGVSPPRLSWDRTPRAPAVVVLVAAVGFPKLLGHKISLSRRASWASGSSCTSSCSRPGRPWARWSPASAAARAHCHGCTA